MFCNFDCATFVAALLRSRSCREYDIIVKGNVKILKVTYHAYFQVYMFILVFYWNIFA